MSTLRLLTRFGSKPFICGGGAQKPHLMASAAFTLLNRNSDTQYCKKYSISSLSIDALNSRRRQRATPLTAPLLQGFAWKGAAAPYNDDTKRCDFGTKSSPDRAGKSDTKSAAIAETDIFGEASKLGLFAKFKLMYKKYWYVLIPVHVVTSIGWLGGFYYLSKSGVDVPSLLQYIHLSETIIQKVQNSDMGHYAIAYLCYKVATPLRYAVTLGGTTVSIKYLVQTGHIKPMPSKQDIIRLYETNKAHRAAVKAEKKATDKTKSQEK